MHSLTFWLHMDELWMWRWHCFDANRRLLARSPDCYFSLEEVETAVEDAKRRMIQAVAA